MKKKKIQILPVQGKILFDVLLVAVLSVLCMLLPFADYTYKKQTYVLSGISFFTTHKVQQGTATVPATGIMAVLILAILLSVAAALVFPHVKKVRIGAYLLLAAGILQFAGSIFFTMQAEYILSETKKHGLAYGIWLEALLGALLIARTLQILYRNRIIGPLDFFVLPGCIYLLINNYFPLFGIFIAFKKIDFSVGIWNSPWVGFENFKYLFASSDSWVMTRNTILYNLAFIILGNILAIIVGIMLNEIISKRFKKAYQTAILLPQLISIIIISYIVYAFLSNEAGLINKSLLGENSINFYNEPAYWPFILVFVFLWKGVGYSSIIYLSSISGIDRSLYEAAYVDGAGKLQQIFKVTLPLLKPTVITLVIMAVGRIFFSDFGLFLQVPMNAGALYATTQTIDTYVYRSLLQLNNISMSSAASVFQSVVGFVVVLAANWIVRKVDQESAMF